MSKKEQKRIDWDGKPVPMVMWGKDHWSTLAYMHSRHVGHNSCEIDHPRMRGDGDEYPTRLRDWNLLIGHDDYHCMEDMEEEGLVALGTRTSGYFRLTDKGWDLATQLARYKLDPDNNFGAFVPDLETVET